MGDYQSIRTVKYANLSHLDHKSKEAGKLEPGIENLCCEIWNDDRNNSPAEDITFTSSHPRWREMRFFGKSPLDWYQFKCKPGEWIFLPHGRYIWTVPSGNLAYRVTINVGDAMFKGNTLPSRPEAVKVRSFVPRVKGSR